MSAVADARWARVEDLLRELIGLELFDLADDGHVEVQIERAEGQLVAIAQLQAQGSVAVWIYAVNREDVEHEWSAAPSIGAWLPIDVVRVVHFPPPLAAWLRKAVG